MQRITWFKDQFGEVYIWESEVIPCTTNVDSADFSLESNVINEFALRIIAPEAINAGSYDWGWVDLPFNLTCTNEGKERVGGLVYA